MNNIRTRLPWLFGGHYKMERFGLSFLALCIAMCIVIGMVANTRRLDLKEVLGNQVMYTTQFVMSRSHSVGDVQSINVSEDGTRCLILIRWQDMTNVAIDASDYQLFLTGSNLSQEFTDLQCQPVASVYMFGNSGYMAIYLVDTNGFPSQILDLTIRSNNDFLSPDGPISDARDGSFVNYDQARIFFNPGAAGRTTADCLEDANMTAYSIYDSVVTRPQEDEIRKQLDADLEQMQQAQAQISEAESLVTMYDLQIPVAPSMIAGDRIVEGEDGTLELETSVVLPGGYDFDWRNGSVKEGYLADVMADADMENETQFFSMKSQEAANAATFAGVVSKTKWYYADGSEFTPSSSPNESSTAMQLASSATGALTEAWTAFYNAKYDYQVTQMGALLSLESTARDMTQHYTMTDTTHGVLTLY